MTETLNKDDETLVRVQAQVMTRDDSSGGWVPMGGGGLSYVGLVRRVRPAEDSTCKNEYLILGQRIADNSVVLKCDIKKDICYTKPNPKFHHWHIEDKRFGLTFERYNDAKAFDKGIRKAVADLTDGYEDGKIDEVFEELELPISRTGSSSQSTTSTTTSSPQSPTSYVPSVPDMMYNNSHNKHLHRVLYFPSQHNSHHKHTSPQSDKSTSSKDSSESQGDIWVKADEPTSISGKSDQGLLDSMSSDNVELKEYSYVIFAKSQPHEYSYPNLEPVQKPPSKREAICSKKHAQITVQPKPPLPMKTSKKKDKHKTSQTGRLLTKARCKHCHETFSHEDNHRGSCEEAPDNVEKCIEIVTCVWCAKGLIYHCMSDADGEYGHPCICDPSDESNCKKWTVLSVLSLFVPCLWCYWPLKACHMCGVSCGCCGGRHKAS
ncbi:sprouty-related, EVH1 domain-containing protein 2-like isoform X2 [Ruditapes philippinarum]|uniref:sprouty-related, EVH1 domain-containing protein 2-like isoform X2 n=1 Tax=Ruditapes philippinarum TaxID=129788 RepID=UPI00295ADF2C|nr:sprouty-related, EVH1 domain-containing protein 2-like isoform X2 [Ruditapes philippinarum]